MRSCGLLLALAFGALWVGEPAAAERDPLLRPTLAAVRAERRALPRVELHAFPGGATATTMRAGRLSFTRFSNGLTATSVHTGRTVFTTLSDGSRAITTEIGPHAASTLHEGRTVITLRNGNVSFSSQGPETGAPTSARGDLRATRYVGPAVVPGGVAVSPPGAFLPAR
jgi:hypothetical protein